MLSLPASNVRGNRSPCAASIARLLPHARLLAPLAAIGYCLLRLALQVAAPMTTTLFVFKISLDSNQIQEIWSDLAGIVENIFFYI